jgi:hypothetical protein
MSSGWREVEFRRKLYDLINILTYRWNCANDSTITEC